MRSFRLLHLLEYACGSEISLHVLLVGLDHLSAILNCRIVIFQPVVCRRAMVEEVQGRRGVDALSKCFDCFLVLPEFVVSSP
jgi:hypothetical protein